MIKVEFYKFDLLEFLFDSNCGTSTNASTAAIGYMAMATDYDVLDAQVASIQQLELLEGFTRFPIYDDARHVVQVGRRRFGSPLPLKEWYNFNGAVAQLPANSDAHQYFPGQFQIACQGVAENTALGSLFVDYVVRFMKAVPIGGTRSSSSIGYAHVRTTPSTGGFVNNVVSQISSSGIFADYPVLGSSTGSNSFSLNAGVTNSNYKFLVFGQASAATTFTSNSTWTAGTNCTLANTSFNLSGSSNSTFVANSTASWAAGAVYLPTVAGSGLSPGIAAVPSVVTGACLADWYFIALPNTFTLPKSKGEIFALFAQFMAQVKPGSIPRSIRSQIEVVEDYDDFKIVQPPTTPELLTTNDEKHSDYKEKSSSSKLSSRRETAAESWAALNRRL